MRETAHERAGPPNEKGPDLLAEIEAPNRETRRDEFNTSRGESKLDLGPIIERVHRGYCWQKFADGPRRIDEPLTPHHIARHLAGRAVFGACPMGPGESTTRVALIDFDSHKGEVPFDQMLACAQGVAAALELGPGLSPVLFRSSGGNGIHLYVLWGEPQDAYSVREALRHVLKVKGLKNGTGGVAKGEAEIFPKQDAVPVDGYGSMFLLPGAGRSERLTPGNDWPLSQPVPVLEKPERPTPAPSEGADFAELHALLAAIPNSGEQSLDYDAWRNVIFAIHHATEGSDEGLLLAEEFSAKSEKCDLDFLRERVWPYITSDRDNPVTIATLRHLVRQHEDPLEDFEALPESPRNGRKRFAGSTPAELFALPRPQWIVKGVIPKAELGVIYGASGSGKSFLALDLFAAVARGAPWRGRKTKPCRVSYIAAEGQGGFRNRLEALQLSGVALEGVAFRVVTDVPNLLREDDRALAEQINADGGADVIVVDTLAQVSPGGDENSAEDMGRVLGHCRRLTAATGAMVILIHHAGKDLSRGARGWSGLKAAADVELSIERDPDGMVRRLVISKAKDGEDGAAFPFKLVPVVLGQDEDGDDITSCVVEHVDAAPPARKEPRSVWAKAVLRAVHDAAGIDGRADHGAIIDRAVQGMPHDPAKRDRRRELALRAIGQLADEGYFSVNGGWIVLSHHSTNLPPVDSVGSVARPPVLPPTATSYLVTGGVVAGGAAKGAQTPPAEKSKAKTAGRRREP